MTSSLSGRVASTTGMARGGTRKLWGTKYSERKLRGALFVLAALQEIRDSPDRTRTSNPPVNSPPRGVARFRLVPPKRAWLSRSRVAAR